MTRDMTEKGYTATKSFEGRSLKAYRDSVGVWTIGFGITNYDEFAVQYLGQKIGAGMVITDEQADYLLHESLIRKYLPRVEKALGAKATDGAFDAGGSFDFNTGAIHKASWAVKYRTGEDYQAALYSWNKAGGHVLSGLTRRRHREYSMAHDNDYGPEGRSAPMTISTNASGKETGVVHTESPAHPLAGTPGMLRKGDTMPEVADLQQHLLKPLFPDVAVTGTFDDATDKAVRAFQMSHPQLGLDGVVGPATRKSLQRAIDAKSKLATGLATTGTPSIGAAVTDFASGGAIPLWAYAILGVAIVGTVAYYVWHYRDEVKAMLARNIAN